MVSTTTSSSGKDQRSIPGSDGKRWIIGNNSAGEGVSYTTAAFTKKIP